MTIHNQENSGLTQHNGNHGLIARTNDPIKKSLLELFIVYGKGEDLDRARAYHKYLKDYDQDIIIKAVERLITSEKFLPALSEILDYVKRQQRDREYAKQQEIMQQERKQLVNTRGDIPVKLSEILGGNDAADIDGGNE